MLNNWINFNDLSWLFKKLNPEKIQQIISALTSSKNSKVREAWVHTYNQSVAWYDLPAVQQRWNVLISGNANVDYYQYISNKYFLHDQLKGLSLGCGTGHRELRWAELGKFQCIDAYDLSPTRIEFAKKNAQKNSYLSIVNYEVADIYSLPIQPDSYDVIFVESSLHHFSPLEEILLKISKALKPSGYYVVNEFVGPTRFQWTNRQLEVVNALLSILPAKYKHIQHSNSIKSRWFRPSLLKMILTDPSEAVESSNIMPLLNKYFNIIELREYGGNILQLLLNDDIAHNFLADDKETQDFLKLCFEVEDLLIKTGDIQSDLVVAVCQKKVSLG